MLKYHTIDTSCRVIPSEVSLIFNITGCTIKCPGCFERTLWKDKGTPLTFNEVRAILNNYSCAVSCVCFMGGEHEPDEINTLARFVKHNYPSLRTAWYSGLNKIPAEIEYCNFDYLKTGPYEASKGALGTPGTHQRVFMVAEDCSLTDITDKYIRTEPDEVRQISVETPETTEEVKDEIIRVLTTPGLITTTGKLIVNNIYERFENIYKGYSIEKVYNEFIYSGESIQDIDKQFFLYPYGGIRIEFNLTTRELCQRYIK